MSVLNWQDVSRQFGQVRPTCVLEAPCVAMCVIRKLTSRVIWKMKCIFQMLGFYLAEGGAGGDCGKNKGMNGQQATQQ